MNDDGDENHSDDRQARTVFVGNVSVDTSRKALKAHFRRAGQVESVRIRCIIPQVPKKISKRNAAISKRFSPRQKNVTAYVVFTSSASVPAAQELNGTVLDGRHLRVDGVGDDPKCNAKKSVFVGNLPFDVDEETLRQAFADNGEGDVTDVRIVRDSQTGLGLGFGFVSFSSRSGVVAALSLDGSLSVDGRNVRIRRVNKQAETKSRGTRQLAD